MTVVKESNCVSMEVERLVKSFAPTAKLVTNVGAELSFILPSTEVARFPELFDKIDGKGYMYIQTTFVICSNNLCN